MTGPGPDFGSFSHLDDRGRGRMVDVSGKPLTARRAVARCTVRSTADLSRALAAAPGSPDPIECARVAAMHAADQTWDLIPLCHPIHLDAIEVAIGLGDAQVRIEATATIVERTGVEMEALTACSVAALVIVATLREVDPRPSIDDLELVSKEGGRSGRWVRDDA